MSDSQRSSSLGKDWSLLRPNSLISGETLACRAIRLADLSASEREYSVGEMWRFQSSLNTSDQRRR